MFAARTQPRRRARGSALLGLALSVGLATPAGALTSPIGASRPDAPGDGAVVRTTAGPVRGVVEKADRIFDGIPFAAPPVGDLRWQNPRPVKPWQTPRDATKPGPECEQGQFSPSPATGPLPAPPRVSEDCLYLNVTVPKGAAGARRLPVMVWIHGGGFVNGSGSEYDARGLATAGNVVVVTVNYRLGAFGFLGLKGLDGSGDFGLADQQAALRWTRQNIAAFGGDPRNVTLFGESAGGMSVCAQLTSPGARALMTRAIAQSGSCATDHPLDMMRPGTASPATFQPVDAVRRAGGELAKTLGCGADAATLACLRKAPARRVLEAANSHWWLPAFGTSLLPEDPEVALTEGHFAHIPIVMGSNRDEARLFVGGSYVMTGHPITPTQYQTFLRQGFGAGADRIGAAYPLAANGTPSLAWAAIITDRGWSCPTLIGADQVLAGQTPVYAYEFADRDAPSFIPFPKDFPAGAAHAAELGYLFPFGGHDRLNPDQRRLAARMTRYWANFAHTGDPNGPDLPTWRRFTSPASALSLAPRAGGIHPVNLWTEHQCALWSGALAGRQPGGGPR